LPHPGEQSVVVTVAGGATDLSTILNDIARDQHAELSFSDGPAAADAHRGLAEFATAIATLGPVISAAGALLQTVLSFAARRGSQIVEITGADGTVIKVPASVSPEQLGRFVDQFQRIQAVHIHVDAPVH
jgi:hypothetical protein